MLNRLNRELLSSNAARIAVASAVLFGLIVYIAIWVGSIILVEPHLIASGAWLSRAVLPDALLLVLIACLLIAVIRSTNRWTRSALIFFIVPLVWAGPGAIPYLVIHSDGWDTATWIAYLIPNLFLIPVLGTVPAAIYLWASRRKTAP